MNIDLLARYIAELAVDHDEISLPEIGTFIVELSPSVFADRGYTVLPPYRKLTFRQRPSRDTLILDRYAADKGVGASELSDELNDFLLEMKEILKSRKIIILPGLGRLRATRENMFFFVHDADLDIYPDGFGLQPVSLRNHTQDVRELGYALSAPQAPDISPEGTGEASMKGEPGRQELPSFAGKAHSSRGKSRRGCSPVLKWCVGIVVAVALLLVALAVLGRVAPQVADRLLYSAEDFNLLHP